VLVSGRGSNLEAILKAIGDRSLDANVAVVLSNKPGVGALDIAKQHEVPCAVVENQGMPRLKHEEAVQAELNKHTFDYIVLAGYMRVLSPAFLKHYRDENGFFRVINIHPSMLPAFPGKNAYEDAFASGATESGITVHLVDEEVDHGPILAQRAFPRQADDTLETFKARGLAVEHELFPQVLQNIAESKNGLSAIAKEHSKK
jgi:formyltetrahydrofolate-dependent phosphoribosylglycinamide formyltransferase